MATTLARGAETTQDAALRRASDCRVEMPHQPGQAHRSAAGWMIDYRLQDLTGGEVRAISTVPDQFADKPAFGSPWHYHDCALQVAIILQGSIELGYQADHYARAIQGDLLFIPGEVPHDVSAPSADYQVAEITFPGTFGTTETQMPEPGAPTIAMTLGPRDAPRVGVARGVIEYAYPIPGPLAGRYAIRRYLLSRVDPFEPGALSHEDEYRIAMVTGGWREIIIGDEPSVLATVGDILLLPPANSCREVALSDDYECIEVRVLRGDVGQA